MESVPRRGITLVLIAGLLSLLAFLALAVVQTARIVSLSGGIGRAALQAESAAESGFQYATARLRHEPRPTSALGSRTTGNACDDWAARRDVRQTERESPARSANPSYARGDRWIDADGDGLYTAGIDHLAPDGDLDGDGRFDAASGRLRGSADGGRPLFALRIRTPMVNVNAGETGSPLDDDDLDGIPNGEDPSYSESLAWNYPGDRPYDTANPAKDWIAPFHPRNNALRVLLDQLGVVTGVSSASGEEFIWEGPNHEFRPHVGWFNQTISFASSLTGIRVIQGRPKGGMPDLEAIRAVLGEADFAPLAPFLATTGETSARPAPTAVASYGTTTSALFDTAWKIHATPEWSFAFLNRIDLNAAPVDVIMAVLLYLNAAGTYHVAQPDPALTVAIESPFVRLQRHETEKLARRIADGRPFHSWRELLAALASPGFDGCFADDRFTAAVHDGKGAIRRLKEDLLLAELSPSPYFPDPFSASFNALDVVREGATAEGFDGTRARRVPSGYTREIDGGSAPYDRAGAVLPGLLSCASPNPAPQQTELAGIRLKSAAVCGLSGIASLFTIESEGWLDDGAVPAGTWQVVREFRPSRAISLTSQQDFEQFFWSHPDSPHPARWRRPGGDVHCDRLPGSQAQRGGIQTHPKFSLTSYDAAKLASPLTFETTEHYIYPRSYGSIRLAARQLDSELARADDGTPCVFALPFNEDDPDAANAFYDAAAWQDNVGDPAPKTGARRSPDPVLMGPGAYLGHPLNQGMVFSPFGPRLSADQRHESARGILAVNWDPPTTPPFPLERGDAVFEGESVPGGGGIQDGTVEFWYPSRAGEETIPGHLSGKLSFRPLVEEKEGGEPSGPIGGGRYFTDYFSVGTVSGPSAAEADGLEFKAVGAQPTRVVPDPALPRRRWRHAAFQLEGQGDTITKIHAYIDGLPTVPATVTVDMGPALNAKPVGYGMQVLLVQAPLDDILMYAERLDPSVIQRHAQRPRYVAAGDYLSPRYAFDPERFPGGAELKGIAWDAFIPEGSSGAIALDLLACDGDDALLNPAAGDPGRNIPCGSDGPQSKIFSIPACRSFRFKVRMSSGDPQESPIFEEVQVFYAPPHGLLAPRD